ncbi:DUF2188 domain-containing protein [Virgibacillus doumboii]|uniref:DUF2188 domain-containing protein n=1 Tax=Virgibacillus doumboii TaxID=2697503 RepID=UPI0013DFB733|nr:DUF2188 domain-containing protein [Virgibacillus doumboii]
MSWTTNNYPSSLKNLDYAVRKKAIDIANAMVDEGYDENRAIPIATRQAKEWYENASSEEIQKFENQGNPVQRSEQDKKYESRPELLDQGEHIVPHDNGWAVQAKDAKQPSDVFEKKSDAVERGKEIARNKGSDITIHRSDGAVERHFSEA